MKFNQNFFEDDLDLNPIKIFGIVISILNIAIVSLFMYAIIWYEKYGTNQNRTLINHFVASACWTGIAYNIILQIPEVIVAFGFTLGRLFCTCSLMLKCILIIHYSSLAGSVAIVKYLYIFVFKNSTGRFDEFWCFFINIFILVIAFVSQFVFQFLPGKNPYYYYVGLGVNPEQGLKTKVNLLLQINLVVCFLLYLYVAIKIKHFNYKFQSVKVEPQLTISSTVNNFHYSTVRQSLKNTLADFTTLAATLVLMLPIISVAIILNPTSGPQLMTFPCYFLVQFHLHVCPFLFSCSLTLSHFICNKKLREVIFRELNHFLGFGNI